MSTTLESIINDAENSANTVSIVPPTTNGLGETISPEPTSVNGSLPKYEKGNTYAIPLQHIVTEKNPSRYEAHSDAELKDLAASMKTYGQLSSCVGDIVEDGADKGRVLLLAGNGRYKAAQLGGIPTLTVWIRSNRRMSHARVNLEENNARRSADTSMDRLKQIIELEAEGLKTDTIAKALRLTPAAISQYRKLGKLIPDLKTLLEDSERNRGFEVTDDDGEKKPRFRFSHALAMLTAIEKATKDDDERGELQERYLTAFRSLKNAKLALEAIGEPEDQESQSTPTPESATNSTEKAVETPNASSNVEPSAATAGVNPGRSTGENSATSTTTTTATATETKTETTKPEHKHPAYVSPLIVSSMLKAATTALRSYGDNPVRMAVEAIAVTLASMGDGTAKALWVPDEDVLVCEENVITLVKRYCDRASEAAMETEAQAIADKLTPPTVPASPKSKGKGN